MVMYKASLKASPPLLSSLQHWEGKLLHTNITFGSSCELQPWQPPKAKDNSGEEDWQHPVHSHIGCRPPWEAVHDRWSFWPPVLHSPPLVNITTQPTLPSTRYESRFQPHICVLLQVWGASCCSGNLRAWEPAAFGHWSAILIHAPRQLDWCKMDHAWERESCRESALLSSRWCNVSGRQDGQRALMHPFSVTRTRTGDGGYSHKRGKSRTEGGRNKQTGRRRCWKPAGEQLFLGESRKDFALRKAVASYFCTYFKVHRTQLWKLHVVFLAGNINIPYGEASIWALQYCLDFILTYFHYWTCLKLYVLFFYCVMGETNPENKEAKTKNNKRNAQANAYIFN